jgi:HK97 gp10 family phage protein
MPDFLSGLALSEEDVKEVLEASAPAAEEEVKKSLKNSVRTAEGSEVVKSVKVYKVTKLRKGSGYRCLIGPSGMNKKNPDGSTRKTPVRNMEVAMYLNYGTSKMAARPWLDKAVNNADRVCTKRMQEEFEKRIKK